MTAMDVILGLLHKRPYSGYEIKQEFQNVFSFFFDASYGTIYPTLAKMEALGYITKESIPQAGRPVKHVYSLTDKGREQFQAYLRSPLEHEVFRSDAMVRLYFGEYADPGETVRWVERKLDEGNKERAELEEIKRRFWEKMSPAQQIVLMLGIEQSKARQRVLEEGLGKLRAQDHR